MYLNCCAAGCRRALDYYLLLFILWTFIYYLSVLFCTQVEGLHSVMLTNGEIEDGRSSSLIKLIFPV